jgi:hypothetical protein
MRLGCHASLTLAVVASAQSPLVIPAAAATVDGNTSTTYPFDVAAGRLLCVYDSSHFTNNGVTQPILNSQIRMRANATTATWRSRCTSRPASTASRCATPASARATSPAPRRTGTATCC